MFKDRATYEKNADDPAQHERYVAYRALMEDEPQWHDERSSSPDLGVRSGEGSGRRPEALATAPAGFSRARNPWSALETVC